MRRASRRDANEAVIVEALRKAGAYVARIDEGGLPDLLVGYQGRTYLVEVKSPLGPQGGASKNGQKLKPLQVAFHASWRGEPVVVVRSPEDALRAIGVQYWTCPTCSTGHASRRERDRCYASHAMVAS